MFMPSDENMERTEHCTLGVTSMLTLSVILLILSEYLPKSDQNFSIWGLLKRETCNLVHW